VKATGAVRRRSASPHKRGAFGGVCGAGACECASRAAASPGADAQGGSENAGSDDNLPYDFQNFLPTKPVIRCGYHPPLPHPSYSHDTNAASYHCP
jgi:hypothetical protein